MTEKNLLWQHEVACKLVEFGSVYDYLNYREKYPDFDVNALSLSGRTLLSHAIDNPSFKMMFHLLDDGADPNIVDALPPYYSPLMHAIMAGNLDMVELLLIYGADINYCTPALDETPLFMALGSERFNFEILGALAKNKKIDLFWRNKRGENAVLYALQKDHSPNVVDALLEFGCELNVVTAARFSTASYVLRCCLMPHRFLDWMIDRGLDVTCFEPNGKSMLDVAQEVHCLPENMKKMYQAGARFHEYQASPELMKMLTA